MTTLYLHIGMPKTGTTSLQCNMMQNQDFLKKYHIAYPDLGFRYPQVGPSRNAHFLVGPKRAANERSDRNIPSADYDAGLDKLRELAAQYETIVLSDESVYYSSQYLPLFWTQLRADLLARGMQLKVIVYLRRQDQFLESLYAWSIKRHTCKQLFREFVEDRLLQNPPYELDYYRYLKRVALALGRENLIVRVFEKDLLQEENGLYSDFLGIFGISFSKEFVVADTYNLRLDNEYLELKRLLNYLPSGEAQHRLLLDSMKELQDVPHPGHGKKQKVTFFAPGEQEKLMASFAESNSRVARKYLQRADGILFREPIVEYPQFSVSDRDLLCCTILAYGRTIEKLNDKIKSLRTEVNTLKKEVRQQKPAQKKTLLSRIKQAARTVR